MTDAHTVYFLLSGALGLMHVLAPTARCDRRPASNLLKARNKREAVAVSYLSQRQAAGTGLALCSRADKRREGT